MTTETLQFDADGLDRWTEENRFEVTRERIAEYAAATNDPIEAHRSGEIANPVFAVVPVFQSLLEPALEVVPLPVLGRVPVTVVGAEHDRLTPVAHAHRLAELIGPSAELVVVPGAGHSVNLTRPEPVDEAFGRLLDRVAARRGGQDRRAG